MRMGCNPERCALGVAQSGRYYSGPGGLRRQRAQAFLQV
ncbi:hypothetical protein ppKF707_1026 [Metapseudomonas furukawaii]|uniref:Uncharacterized protein n=1 Tax=Metapseudomonas furukawaii TaxID=1149133 RepID=A0AAD1FFV1_METFU|nr:hypothetical protein ppKF707_1026 [Pseudomonas furukawaii]BAU75265.1 hypothetical protein KF707C_35770 [Pseudomonas furukawaii]